MLAPLLACVVGCLTADATLKADGSAAFDITYRTAPNTTADAEKKRYSSDHVTVESVSFKDATTATMKGRVDDLTKLSTAEGFKNVTVTRTPADDDVKLEITITNSMPAAVKDTGQPGPKFTLHLPGAVREANHDAKVSGDTVTWSFSFPDWMKEKSTTMTVRYAGPKAAAGAPTATTPPAKSDTKAETTTPAPAGTAKGKPAKH